jgi:hypothetical protein
MYSLQLSGLMSTKWLTAAPPYIPDAVVPAPHLEFVQVRGSHFLDWLKRFWGWARACNLAGNFHRHWGCAKIQKKKQEPF